MPTIVEPFARTLPYAELPRLRWTVESFEDLAGSGLLPSGRRYELLDGDVVPQMPIKPPHVIVITLLFQVFSGIFGFDHLLTQFLLWIDENNLPEPDFAVTARPIRDLLAAYPRPDDLRLLIGVSSTTLSSDLTTKALLYARAGIGDYWVLDVEGKRLFIHRDPGADGYNSVVEFGPAETVAALCAPDAFFTVSALLP